MAKSRSNKQPESQLTVDSVNEFSQDDLEAFAAPKVKAPKPASTSKADQRSWNPRRIPMRFDWIKKSQEDRARTRLDAGTVLESGNQFLVMGMDSLGDRFDEYRVNFDPGTNRFACTCQGHAYGDTRNLCTHAIAVILKTYEPEVSLKIATESQSLERDRVELDSLLDVHAAKIEKLPTPPFDEWDPVRLGLVWEFVSELMATQQGHDSSLQESSEPSESVHMENVAGLICEASPEEIESSEKMIKEWQRRQEILEQLPETKPDPSRWSLPAHFTSLRDHQWDALRQIVQHWAAGRKFVFLDAPTGAGKSLLGCASLLEWAGVPSGKPQTKGFVAVTSLDLQDQMDRDFTQQSWFAMLKGRANYSTANYPDRYQRGKEKIDWDTHVDCSDCEYSQKKHCRYCDPPGVTGPSESGSAPCLGRCPYKIAFRKTVNRVCGMTNMQYLLRVANSMAWGNFDDRSILVADECDTMESVFMGWVTVEVSEKNLAVLGDKVGRPTVKTYGESAKGDWFAWAGRAKARIAEIISRRNAQMKGEVAIDPQEPGERYLKRTSDNKDLRRDVDRWSKLSDNLVMFMDSMQAGDPWVYDGYIVDKETKRETGPVVFKPVRVNMFGKPRLFDRFENVLMMSATLISADQIARDMGIESHEYGVVTVPRTFDSSRCPVFVCPVADNSMKERANSWPRLVAACEKILSDNKDHRIMIHAVSYDQADKISQHLKNVFRDRRIVSHSRDSFSKKSALETYEKNPSAVLISPSMARGADFKGDLCRVQIIIKVPFPNLGDKQISARLHGTHDGQTWYAVQTVREIVQMTGRCMRSEDDWGQTWILDSQFMNVWNKNSQLFPGWWRESVRFVAIDQAGGR